MTATCGVAKRNRAGSWSKTLGGSLMPGAHDKPASDGDDDPGLAEQSL